MSLLYADENFPLGAVVQLRALGHDVLTAFEAGQANQKIPDPAVLAYAVSLGRAILTINRRHFIKLHKTTATHSGIVVCTNEEARTIATRICPRQPVWGAESPCHPSVVSASRGRAERRPPSAGIPILPWRKRGVGNPLGWGGYCHSLVSSASFRNSMAAI